MALGLLCLGLTLLGALQTQARYIPLTLVPVPPLSKMPLQPGFRYDQFQGKWFSISIAANTIWNDEGSSCDLFMYRDIYQLEDDHSYNVTTTTFREDECEQWSQTFVPYIKPGQFSLDNNSLSDGLDSYIKRVAATDYSQFAMTYCLIRSKNTVFFQTVLYGRSKELSPELKQRFVDFAKSLGLSDNNVIFFKPTEKCI